MSCGGKEKQWTCRKAASAAAIVAAAAAAGTINLQRVGSIVRDIGDPCLSQSPIKVVLAVNKMLKPEKWQAIFDDTGKVSSFQKALKSIILGGVDPSIRPEVWEFLLGCYSLGSTADYRRQLRTARRERFKDLIKQCQTMHSSIGTGSLAYVGSKVMDMRTSSKDGEQSGQVSTVDTDKTEKDSNSRNYCTDKSNAGQKESSKDSANLVNVGENSGNATHDSCFLSACGPYGRCSSKTEEECHGSEYITESDFDFPPLPVTDLFEKNEDEKETDENEKGYAAQHKLEFEDDNMHSFQITNNADLIMESNVSPSLSNNTSRPFNSEIELVHGDAYQPAQRSKTLSYEKDSVNRLSISDATETPLLNSSRSQEAASNDKRVSEWLWTLHRIVVDVVRTDSHLDFYEDRRNLARMSDILAVYAWVDPATGYCQGMSDLLSPFIVLFEDNADAFWCFEMLIRRMRDNFQMEGPTGVMKQLQALWHILELTDREIFSHLSNIGAESLHFAFPMLLVLFRRELSFTEALRMWEMMWAADFDESFTCNLEEICLEPLVVQLPKDFGAEIREEISENGNDSVKGGPQLKHSLSDDDDGIKSMSAYPFCGLARSFWWRSDHLQICNVFSSARRGADYLPVFCVAAILIINRHKIIKETRSIDDMIKIFNDKLLKIHVKRCIGAAIKLRKKYFYKLVKNKGHSAQHSE